jgi:hypothetical protein
VPLHDAIKAMPFPVIEVHMSNIAAREPWRVALDHLAGGQGHGPGPRLALVHGWPARAGEMAREAGGLNWTPFLRRYCRLLDGVIAACLARWSCWCSATSCCATPSTRHRGLGGAVALALRLAHLHGRRRRPARAHPPRHRHAGRPARPIGKKACLVVAYALMLLMCWMLFNGSLEQTKINWDVTAPSSGASMAWFYSVGLVFASRRRWCCSPTSTGADRPRQRGRPRHRARGAGMTILVFVGSLLAAMAIGIPISFACWCAARR